MKKQILKIALAATIVLGAYSCKEKAKDVEVSEVTEVVENKAPTTNYAVDTQKSVISWKGSKPGGSHTGTIKISDGMVAAANKDVVSGKFTIDMTSLVSTDLEGGMKESLEAHLKGTEKGKEKDFFNVTEFPNASFLLTGVSGENGKVVVRGDLTIKGKTNPVEFPAVVSFPGNDLFLLSKTFTINRTEWDINFMSKSVFDNLKDKFIDDEIELTVELYATKG